MSVHSLVRAHKRGFRTLSVLVMVSFVFSGLPVGLVLAEDTSESTAESAVVEQMVETGGSTETSTDETFTEDTGGESASGEAGVEGGEGADVESGDTVESLTDETGESSEESTDEESSNESVNVESTGGTFDETNEETVDSDPEVTQGEVVSSGEDGTGSDAGTSEGSVAAIETGDAEAEVDVVNDINSNDTSVSGGGLSGGEIIETTHESDTEENTSEAETSYELEAPVTITADNDTELDNDVSVSAATGANTASSNAVSGILSGNAISSANIINVVNTNIVNSEGMIMLMNAFDGIDGHLNLQSADLFDVLDNGDDSESCALELCSGVSMDIEAENDAQITNDVIVRAATGDNEILGNTGDALISTGDAFAAANVMNVVNTNIVDSNYLLVTVNSFGSLNGNILMPSANSLFGQSAASTPAMMLVDNENNAEIDNNSNTTVGSGDNTAMSATSESSVESGQAVSQVNIANAVNQNLLGGNSFTMLVRVHGTWDGDVLGVPDGLAWEETEEGLVIYSEAASGPEGVHALSGVGNSLAVANTNNASVKNNVEVIALTGDNRVSSEAGAAMIKTGDAYAATNIVNVVNTNIVGQNWFLGIFNVFGDWNGSVVFGRPDLWVGAQITTDTPNVRQGDIVTYRYTVMNNGDGFAPNVRLYDRINTYHLALAEVREGVSMLGDTVMAEIGDLMPGEIATVEYRIAIKTNLPTGRTFFTHNPYVVSDGEEVNEADNSDIVTLAVDKPASEQDNQVITYTPDPVLNIVKTQLGPGTTTASSTVDYEVLITNEGGIAYHAMLVDMIKDERGRTVYKQSWPLESIFPGEEIRITYSVEFSDETVPGIYTNYAEVRAVGRHPSFNPFYGYWANSSVASTELEVVGEEGYAEQEVSEDENQDEVAVPVLPVDPEIGGSLEDLVLPFGEEAAIEDMAIRETIIAIPGEIIRDNGILLAMQNGDGVGGVGGAIPATALTLDTSENSGTVIAKQMHGQAASAFMSFTQGMSNSWWWLWLIIMLGSAPVVAYQTHEIIRARRQRPSVR